MIKDLEKLELTKLCVGLLVKTYTSLGQTPSEETLSSMSFLLSGLLEKRYKTFTWETVELSFYNGTTNTEVFHINIQTMSKWLYTMKQLIWDGEAKMKEGSYHAINKEIRGIIDEQRKLLK
jgi:hypothetical protein|tara:strand:+ start:248 stop:610 length:363 start_codon:yes stop_codon:yes gene_type:complete